MSSQQVTLYTGVIQYLCPISGELTDSSRYVVILEEPDFEFAQEAIFDDFKTQTQTDYGGPVEIVSDTIERLFLDQKVRVINPRKRPQADVIDIKQAREAKR